jgi:hypothetical protein
MDLEYVLDTLPPALKDFYTAKDGKFHLNLKGEHPKVKEMRDTNISLLKERDALTEKYKDIDPASVATERAELAELRKGSPRITALEAELAAEKAKTMAAEAASSRVKLRSVLSAKAAAAGVRPEALEIAVDKLEADFVISGDTVQAKPGLFSADRPGELRTPEESLTAMTRSMGFLFKPSSGSGAPGNTGSIVGTSNVRELRNPSPQQLGQYAADIKAGRMKVVHD